MKVTDVLLRTTLEEQLTEIINSFQIQTGLVVDDLSLTFEGVRVEVVRED